MGAYLLIPNLHNNTALASDFASLLNLFINEPRREREFYLLYANNKDADQTARIVQSDQNICESLSGMYNI